MKSSCSALASVHVMCCSVWMIMARLFDNLWVSVWGVGGGEKGGVTHNTHTHTHTHTTHSHTGHLVIKNKALGGARRTQKPRFRTMYRTFRSTSEEERLIEHMSEVIPSQSSCATIAVMSYHSFTIADLI